MQLSRVSTTWQTYIVDNSVDNACSLAAQYVSDDSDSPLPQASRHTSQYFIEVRGNSIEGSFGDTGNQTNVENKVGSGIQLLGQILHLSDNGVPVATNDHMGFGVTVSHNTLDRAALAVGSTRDVWAIGVATGGAPLGESLMPAYDDTLIFKNHVSNLPAPWLPDSQGPGDSLSISNGQSTKLTIGFHHDYPYNTTVCANDLQSGAASIGDFHGSLASTLIICP